MILDKEVYEQFPWFFHIKPGTLLYVKNIDGIFAITSNANHRKSTETIRSIDGVRFAKFSPGDTLLCLYWMPYKGGHQFHCEVLWKNNVYEVYGRRDNLEPIIPDLEEP